MKSEKRHSYRFKAFRLEVEERQLLHHDHPVPLTPKAFDVLVALVEQSGHLVEKEELLQSVWSGSFVEEANIARIVHTLRKTLGENANDNKFIETVAKKGYRFVATVSDVPESFEPHTENGHIPTASESLRTLNVPVQPEENALEAADSGKTADALTPVLPPVKNRRLALFGAVFLSSALLLLLLFSFFYFNSPVDQNKVRSIAVLPLKPINTANRDELYEIGIADSMIHRFSRTKNLLVRPLSATRKYMNIEQDPVAAGREQKVDYVLASNYQLSNGKIRVTSQLINVATGQIEQTFQSREIDTTNIFTMQDAVASEVSETLIDQHLVASNYKWGWGNFSIKVEPAENVENPPTKLFDFEITRQRTAMSNKEAYRLYWQGKFLTEQRVSADAEKAIEYFERSLELDPTFASAYSGLANAYIMSGRLNGMPPERIAKAREAINRALELDNNLAEGYEVRGFLKLLFDWDFAGAEKDLLRAAELEPNSVQGLEFRAEYLASCGRLDEAIAVSENAIRLDPVSLALQHDRGRLLYRARRYDEAILALTKIIETDGNFVSAYGTLHLAYEKKGDYSGAFNSFINFVKRTTPEQTEIYQKIYQTSGWHAVQRKHIEYRKLQGKSANEGKSANGNSGAWNYGLALMSAMSGEKEEALAYLNKAVAQRPAQMIRINVEPAFDVLRDDPRFDELIGRVGLK